MPTRKTRVLVVDDEPAVREVLEMLLQEWGFEVRLASDGVRGEELAGSYDPDIVISDVVMPQISGLDLLRSLKVGNPARPVVLVTAQGSIELAVEAMKQGAQDFITKPLDYPKLRSILEAAQKDIDLREESRKLSSQLERGAGFCDFIGISKPMREVYELIQNLSSSDAFVIVTGESGTGKELVARSIHTLSARSSGPFIAINAAAIPETLMESEIFGHEKGAFTGAASRRQGCFELADTGTLLLDEIAEMPSLLQAKLLRAIEERAIRRLGSRKEISVDVRILAATNRSPEEAIQSGNLREDLLYRLNVFRIALPPLKDRKEDLPLLAQHLVTQLAEKHNRPARFLSSGAITALQFHAWPGNVRELRNVIERAVIICSGEQIERHHFAPYPIEQRVRLRDEDTITMPVGTPLEECERQMIMRTLQKTKNNKTRAAELLGISLKTLHNKLNLYRDRGLLPTRESDTPS